MTLHFPHLCWLVSHRWVSRAALASAFMSGVACQPAQPAAAATSTTAWQHVENTPSGPVFKGDGWLKLEVCTTDIVRVLVSQDKTFLERKSLATEVKQCDPRTQWTFEPAPRVVEGVAGKASLTTDTLKITLDAANGSVAFSDKHSGVLLEEQRRSLEPVSVQGESAYSVRQVYKPRSDEAFFGLGQHQQGLMDISQYPLDLVQYNTEIVVPMLVSSKGYGIFWDNTSWTRWGDLQAFTTLSRRQREYKKTFVAERAGAYLFRTYASGSIRLSLDGKEVIRHYRQGWLPGIDYARVQLARGQSVQVHMQHEADMGVSIADLDVKPPALEPNTSLWSHVADGIDYYFIRGPELDNVIAGYRQLTGQAPLPPRWAFGLWQCRERYKSAAELLEVLEEFRRRQIPIDNIVQDWQFWEPGKWGSHAFDRSRFPDPKGWIEQIHAHNAQLMISVWPKFHAGTDNFKALEQAGFLYPKNAADGIKDFRGYKMSYYDAFNAEARALYWSQIQEQLMSLGIDAWWMDATEPEVVEGPYDSPDRRRQLYQEYMHPTALGSGSRMLNAYSLVNSKAVYEGQRQAAPNQRVFILTRSAFAGQQRYASASWSGDVTSTWTAFKKQISAGLSFSLSGIPYWTMDIGGFAVPPKFQRGDSEEWFELNTRWFQWGTFVPLLRVHGQHPPREMWTMGGDDHTAYKTHVRFARLRYRLLPYIYSLAGAVTHSAGSMLRALVMDFPDDLEARSIADQYMFGPAFLVSPVTDYQARTRRLLLPQSEAGWYDFWTGQHHVGGQHIEAPAPLESMPLFMRAGSIVPVGPELQYTTEKPADPIRLYVYTGRDASFDLYEDDGLSYDYERGAHARIPLHWSESSRTLRIGARVGQFPGQLQDRRFEVVFVSPRSPQGFSFEAPPGKGVRYQGSEVTLTDAAE